MGDSLKDQLMALGFKPGPEPQRKQQRRGPPPRKSGRSGGKGGGAEPDLARAYALREREEQAQRQREQREREEQARHRREARAKLEALLQDKVRNDPGAEHPRHFEYGGRIRRVHVTPDQLAALNSGRLDVVQVRGRYLLVEPEVAEQAEQILPGTRVVHVEPDAAAGDEHYGDPRFQVPDDLVW